MNSSPIAKTMTRVAIALTLTVCLAWSQTQKPDSATSDQSGPAARAGQVRIPQRAVSPLFKGEQGKQRTEIHFDRATGVVTMKLLVQDPNGYFIPNLRPENFAVFENGVRQTNVNVNVEHAPVSLALLLEWGGRYPSLNKTIATEVSMAARQLLEVTGHEDKIAV